MLLFVHEIDQTQLLLMLMFLFDKYQTPSTGHACLIFNKYIFDINIVIMVEMRVNRLLSEFSLVLLKGNFTSTTSQIHMIVLKFLA